jgi:hypothetical protein
MMKTVWWCASDVLCDVTEWLWDHVVLVVILSAALCLTGLLTLVGREVGRCEAGTCPDGLTARMVSGYGCICVLAPKETR